MRRILVTGASGLLGSNLALELVSQGFEVVAQYGTHPIRIPGAESVFFDLTAVGRIRSFILELRPDVILHGAAMTSVDGAETQPDLARTINVEASAAIAVTAKQLCARLVHISTDSVFDGCSRRYTEADEANPVNVYARTKREAELRVAEVNPDALILRTNIFGWNAQPKTSLAEWILERAFRSVAIPGFVDVVFTPILVNDLIREIIRISEHTTGGVFHMAGGDAVSKHDFAKLLCSAFALDPALVQPASSTTSGLAAPRPKNTSLDCAKASRELGFDPPKLAEGIRRFRALYESDFRASLLRSVQ